MLAVAYAQVTQNLTRETGKTFWISSDDAKKEAMLLIHYSYFKYYSYF